MESAGTTQAFHTLHHRPTRTQVIFYYLSFVLIWTTVALVASMFMMDYEDKWDGTTPENKLWVLSEMKGSHQVGYAVFLTVQAPFGLLFGLLTGHYHVGWFACVINPLFIAWALHMIFRNTQRKHVRRTLMINYATWMAIVVAIMVVVVSQ